MTHDPETLFAGGRQNLLFLLLWVLADQTTWSPGSADLPDLIAYALGELSPERQGFAERILRLPDQRWPHDLPMDALCRQLDQVQTHDLNLGRAVRYAFAATDLEFADISREELEELGWTGMNWYSVDFAAIAADQAEARTYAEHYHRLDALVSTDLDVFDTVLAQLIEAATRLERPAPTTT